MFNIKKKFFTRMLKGTQAEIWDSEFNKFTALRERENQRLNYDTAVQAVEQMKADPNNTKEQLENAQKQLEFIKANIDEFDVIISGTAPTEEYPEGRVGIDTRLENQMKRKNNIEAFIKHNC